MFSQFDPKWPLTSTKNNRVLVLNVVHLHTTYEICSKLPCLRYHVYKVFTIWPLLTPNDLWPPPKTIGFLYSMWYTYIPNMRSVQASLLEISCLQGFYNVFTIWPLLTPNDLWPPPKTIGFLYSMRHSYIPNMRSVQASLLEISCLQGFYKVFTIWPLLTPNDLWPPPKNNRLLVLNGVHLHTKYEICPSFPSWDIVFTSRRHDTHTHTHTYTHTYIHTHAIMNAKVTIIIETKKGWILFAQVCVHKTFYWKELHQSTL